MKTSFILLITFICGQAVAATNWLSVEQQTLAQGKSNYKASSFCGDDTQCQTQVTNPSQQSYYTNSTDASSQGTHDQDLINAGTSAIDHSDVKNDIAQRQQNQSTVDLTNATYATYNKYLQDAAINKFADCKAGKIAGGISTSRTTCTEPTGATISCKLTLVPSTTEYEWQDVTKTVPFVVTRTNSNMVDYTEKWIELEFPSQELTLKNVTLHSRCMIVRTDYNTGGLDFIGDALQINGVWKSIVRGNTGKPTPVSFNMNTKITDGRFAAIYFAVGGTKCQGSITAMYTALVPKLVWKQNCNTQILNQYSCNVASQSCTEGAATHTVNGISYTEPCWEQTQHWACTVGNTCKKLPNLNIDPSKLVSGQTSCTATSKQCAISADGACLQTQNNETCYTRLPDNVNLDCDVPVQCNGTAAQNAANPACKTTSYNSKTSMPDTVAKLSILNAIGKHFDPNSLRFFTGKPMSCAIGAIGSFNCCSDSGWLNGGGLHSCSTEEKDLGIAKEKNMAIYVGTYCADKTILGICLRHKKSYCVYNSQISKITMSAAQSQLHKSFGGASSPNCSGLTEQQIKEMNWEKIDWGPVISDVKVTLPNADDLKNKVNNQVSNNFINGGGEA